MNSHCSCCPAVPTPTPRLGLQQGHGGAQAAVSPVLYPPRPLNAAFLHCLQKSTSSSTISLTNKTRSNFGLGIFVSLPPVPGWLVSSENSAGLRAAQAHKALSVGTSRAVHTGRQCVCFRVPLLNFRDFFSLSLPRARIRGWTWPHPDRTTPALMHPALSHSLVLSSGCFLQLCDPALPAQPFMSCHQSLVLHRLFPQPQGQGGPCLPAALPRRLDLLGRGKAFTSFSSLGPIPPDKGGASSLLTWGCY